MAARTALGWPDTESRTKDYLTRTSDAAEQLGDDTPVKIGVGGFTMRVSIVDDHPIVLEAIKATVSFLDPASMVESFGDLESFLAARAGAPAPDIVLLDLILPGHDGVSAVLRCREACPDVPIVVFSGITDPEVVLGALDAGAMSVIPKTASGDELVGAIRTVLGGGYYVPREVFASGLNNASASSGKGIPPADTQALEALTERQQHVLRLLLRGAPNKRIGTELELSENTVKSHVSAILRALGARNRTQAVLTAHRLGLSHRLRSPGDR